MDTRENDFLMPCCQQQTGLFYRRLQRQRAYRSPYMGDNAILTKLIAAIFDLQICARPWLDIIRRDTVKMAQSGDW